MLQSFYMDTQTCCTALIRPSVLVLMLLIWTNPSDCDLIGSVLLINRYEFILEKDNEKIRAM